jgi:hypothetical protein
MKGGKINGFDQMSAKDNSLNRLENVHDNKYQALEQIW